MSRLQKKPADHKRGHPTLQNMNFFSFCGSFLPSLIRIRIQIPNTDRDPDPLARLNTDPIRIRIRIRNPVFFFVGHFWPPGAWIRIHNTAWPCRVAVVMNRNVNYIRKVLYIVVCSSLSCHQIFTRGSGSGTDQGLATQNNTDPVGFRFRSAILQKRRGYRYFLCQCFYLPSERYPYQYWYLWYLLCTFLVTSCYIVFV
jgi:hypothetical protein